MNKWLLLECMATSLTLTNWLLHQLDNLCSLHFQIEIVLGKTDKFDEIMATAAEDHGNGQEESWWPLQLCLLFFFGLGFHVCLVRVSLVFGIYCFNCLKKLRTFRSPVWLLWERKLILSKLLVVNLKSKRYLYLSQSFLLNSLIFGISSLMDLILIQALIFVLYTEYNINLINKWREVIYEDM